LLDWINQTNPGYKVDKQWTVFQLPLGPRSEAHSHTLRLERRIHMT